MSTFHERRQTGRVFDASFRWFTDFLNGVLGLSNQRIVSTHKRAPVNDILCRFEWGETCRVEKKGSKKRWKKPQEEPQRRDLSLSQDRQMCSRCRIYRTEQQNHSLQVAHFFTFIRKFQNTKFGDLWFFPGKQCYARYFNSQDRMLKLQHQFSVIHFLPLPPRVCAECMTLSFKNSAEEAGLLCFRIA